MSEEEPKTWYVYVQFIGENRKIYAYKSTRPYAKGAHVTAAPYGRNAECIVKHCTPTPCERAQHWLVEPTVESPKNPRPFDVIGEYPLEKLPKLLEVVKEIVAKGNCLGIVCYECPCTGMYHRSENCQNRHHSGSTKAIPAAWFEKFIEEYDRTQLGSLVDIPEGRSVPMELHPEFNVVGTLVSWGIPRRRKHYLYEVAQVKGLA